MLDPHAAGTPGSLVGVRVARGVCERRPGAARHARHQHRFLQGRGESEQADSQWWVRGSQTRAKREPNARSRSSLLHSSHSPRPHPSLSLSPSSFSSSRLKPSQSCRRPCPPSAAARSSGPPGVVVSEEGRERVEESRERKRRNRQRFFSGSSASLSRGAPARPPPPPAPPPLGETSQPPGLPMRGRWRGRGTGPSPLQGQRPKSRR